MQELDDSALLREYVGRDSEEAFATLVARHVNKVYSVALRHVGNTHLAEEITQAVFVLLARKSKRLGKHVILEGWLYQTARLISLTCIRGNIRRAGREQEAYVQTTLNENEPEIWSQIAPLLDSAMAGLNEKDRHAVVLRFFYGKSMKEIGSAVGGTEGAVRIRLHRALEKLRQIFARHGVSSTAETIGNVISTHSVAIAPAALAKTATAAALAKGVSVSGSTFTIVKGALKVMAWTKAKTVIVAGACVLLATGTTVSVLESKARAQAEREKDFVAYEIQHRSLLQKIFPQPVSNTEIRRQLAGVWTISAKRFLRNPNAKFAHFPTSNPHLKTWTLTNWAIITYDSKSNVVYSASGPYELNGDVYTETVESATGPMTNGIGAQYTYKLRVEGDKYYQMGMGIEESGQRVQ